MTDNPVITASEAARIVGVHPRTLINAILRGRVKGHKMGPVWAIEAESLEAYIRQRQQRQATHEP